MKRYPQFIFVLFSALLLTVGCAKDNIVLVDPVTESDEADYIENTDFSQTVAVVFHTDAEAEVSGLTDSISASVNGNHVTITNLSSECVYYELSGATDNGSFKLYSTRKHAIALNDVSLTNPVGAAINVQAKRTFIVVNGSNILADGATYSATPSDEDEKAAVFGEGQLIFSGTGTLTVNAQGKSGITSDDYVHIMEGPTLKVSSTAGHGIRGKDYILVSGGDIEVNVSADMKKGFSTDGYVRFDGGTTQITVNGGTAYDSEDGEYTGSAGIKADGKFLMNGGSLTITNSGTGGKGISCDGNGYFNGGTVRVTTTGSNYGSSGGGGFPGGGGSSNSDNSVSAKGIKFDGNLIFAGSTVVVNCAAHEGIEAKGSLDITAGEVYSYSAKDDAINSGGDFTISGGAVYGYAPNNDGLDANGDFYVKGGLVYAIGASSPEVGLDANTEGNKQLYVQGGTLIVIGGLEQGASLTQSCYSTSSWSQNTWYALTVGSTTYAFKTPASGGNALVVSGSSTPSLQTNVTVSDGEACFEGLCYQNATVTGGSSVTLSSYTGGNGGGGGPGGGGHGPF